MAELIVAFDVASTDQARRLADSLPGLKWAKIGPMLLLAEGGTALIGELRGRGVKIFLDCKWHDIPNTVAGAVRAAAALGVDLATVHALGGRAMVRAAVEARGGMRLAGVSVLTSHTADSFADATGRADLASGGGGADLGEEVARLTRLLVEAGVDAIVTSPQEIARVRALAGPDRWIVVPGIRPAGSAAGDQRRTATPEQAAAAGATHLVVGRPVIEAREPRAVYQALCDAIT
jgi:orotidine-5'-phosphate decarboxylase